MVIEAPISKSVKNWLIIYMIALVVFGAYCFYDGYFNKKFIQEHSDEHGKPNSTLFFNQKSPPLFFIGAVLLGLRLFLVRNKRIVAEDNDLVVDDKLRINYDSIQEIDKTLLKEKGIFVVSYDTAKGKRVNRKFDCQKYDNMQAVLDLLVEKIT